MPESVSGVDAILDGLRDATRWTWPTVLHGPPSRDPSKDGRVEMVPLDDAVAAVHAAADARTQEIVEEIRDGITMIADNEFEEGANDALESALGLIARRFPNGGTDA